MDNPLNTLEARLKGLKLHERKRELHGVYRQLVLSNKGRKTHGLYRNFVDTHPHEKENLALFVADQLDSSGMSNQAERVRNSYDSIRTLLNERLHRYKLDKRVSVEPTAYRTLREISHGEWQIA